MTNTAAHIKNAVTGFCIFEKNVLEVTQYEFYSIALTSLQIRVFHFYRSYYDGSEYVIKNSKNCDILLLILCSRF